ncbi:MAG: DUF1343 domain-containing protein [Gemmatimonadota bacterium]|nr:DUF1343 domain-containing protein [Gemmatimonadota bacterium]
MRPGVDVLLDDSLHLVRERAVGLITNHTGLDRMGRSSIDRLADRPDIDLVALFSPEHGIEGRTEAGESVTSRTDARTGLPIHSLYGDTRRPSADMLEGIDVLLFDLQDVGARYYTYVYTMAYAMEEAGRHDIPFVVLDRPNPIGGEAVQGNVLDPDFSTFVGLYPIPMRHGMTPAELARLYVGEFGIDVDLGIVPVAGLTRSMTFDRTDLPWVPPSPNMPSLESALAYPGTCLFEGTPLSVGRGTERAFQWVGAPWLDGEALAERLNAYEFEDARFEATSFTPDGPGDGKFDGVEVHGVRVVPEDPSFDAPKIGVAMILEARRMSGDDWEWNVAHFDRLAGTDALRRGIEAGHDLEELTRDWTEQLRAFEEVRSRYLIYP